jgi:thioredoxin-related protein
MPSTESAVRPLPRRAPNRISRLAVMRWLLWILMLACAPARAQEPPAWFSQSLLHLPDDVAEAKAQGKRVMLYFGQDGCPYCKRLMEVNFKDPAIVAKAQRHLHALALNIWGDRDVTWTDGSATTEKRLAATLKVQFTPTLLFLDESGGIALRLNGYYPPREFELALDYVAARLERDITFRQYLEQRGGAAAPRPKALYDLRRDGGRPLAVLFEGPACTQCEELHAVVMQRQEVREQLQRFDLARLALGEGERVVTPQGREMAASRWAEALRVGYAPTMVLFDARGREVFRTEAYLRPFHVAGALEYVSSGAYRREPSFQRFLQARAERLKRQGNPVDLWN